MLYGNKLFSFYKNPLDISFKKGNLQLYFPLGSSLIISILISLFFYLFKK